MLHRMPTANPRISVTLTPEVAAVLKRVCDLAEKSQSAFVGELLTESIPVFERMARVLEAAHQARHSFNSDLAESLDQAQTRLEQQLGLALETMEEGFRPVLEAAEIVKRRGPRTGGTRVRGAPSEAGAAAKPPMSNRGVTPHPSTPKRAKRAASSGR